MGCWVASRHTLPATDMIRGMGGSELGSRRAALHNLLAGEPPVTTWGGRGDGMGQRPESKQLTCIHQRGGMTRPQVTLIWLDLTSCWGKLEIEGHHPSSMYGRWGISATVVHIHHHACSRPPHAPPDMAQVCMYQARAITIIAPRNIHQSAPHSPPRPMFAWARQVQGSPAGHAH